MSSTDESSIQYNDYISIYLANGRVGARFNFNGNGQNVADQLEVRGGNSLSDGKWHRVMVVQVGRVRLRFKIYSNEKLYHIINIQAYLI